MGGGGICPGVAALKTGIVPKGTIGGTVFEFGLAGGREIADAALAIGSGRPKSIVVAPAGVAATGAIGATGGGTILAVGGGTLTAGGLGGGAVGGNSAGKIGWGGGATVGCVGVVATVGKLGDDKGLLKGLLEVAVGVVVIVGKPTVGMTADVGRLGVAAVGVGWAIVDCPKGGTTTMTCWLGGLTVGGNASAGAWAVTPIPEAVAGSCTGGGVNRGDGGVAGCLGAVTAMVGVATGAGDDPRVGNPLVVAGLDPRAAEVSGGGTTIVMPCSLVGVDAGNTVVEVDGVVVATVLSGVGRTVVSGVVGGTDVGRTGVGVVAVALLPPASSGRNVQR